MEGSMKRGACTLALLLAAHAARAETVAFVTANVTAQRPAIRDFTQTGSGPSREETATLSSAQTLRTSRAYDVGGGLLRGSSRWKAGLGVAVSHMQQSPTAAVTLSMPHPILFDRSATATATSAEGLDRQESAVHIQAVLERRAGRLASRVFAGPSYVRLAQTLVSEVRTQEALDLSPQLGYAVAIAGIDPSRAVVSAWGYHVGADIDVLVGRHLGTGLLVRYTRATATVPNHVQDAIDGGTGATTDVTLGGVAVGAGVRLRF
jgi:hypothetical protein